MTIHKSLTLEVILDEYKQHQRCVRGLREVTLHGYEPFMRAFLRFSLGQDPLDPTVLAPADVVGFVTSLRDRYSARSCEVRCARCSVSCARGVTAMRRWSYRFPPSRTGGWRRCHDVSPVSNSSK